MVAVLIVALRVFVGLLIIKAGVDLATGDYAFSGYADFEPLITGLFVILIGIHIVFQSIFK